MAKTIDLSAKLDNSRPLIKIAEGKIYEVDNRKNTVLLMDQKLKAAGDGDIEAIEEIIRVTLGEEAAKEIEAMDLPLASYSKIVIAIMAAISEESFEDVEARFQREKNRFNK